MRPPGPIPTRYTYTPLRTSPSLRHRSRVKVVAYGHAPDIIRESAILGRAIVTGVFIYTTLNWMHYRQTRVDMEKESEKDRDDRNKKKTSKR